MLGLLGRIVLRKQLSRVSKLVISNFAFVDPQQSPPRERSASAFPWWPEIKYEGEIYHSSTQLEGYSSILVDPGAYTNLVGSEWAAL